MSKANWVTVKEYEDITYKKCNGVARIAFNRPNVRNAFRPHTVDELYRASKAIMREAHVDREMTRRKCTASDEERRRWIRLDLRRIGRWIRQWRWIRKDRGRIRWRRRWIRKDLLWIGRRWRRIRKDLRRIRRW